MELSSISSHWNKLQLQDTLINIVDLFSFRTIKVQSTSYCLRRNEKVCPHLTDSEQGPKGDREPFYEKTEE